MPQILVKLMELCQSEDAGIAELASLISKDAAMTAKILRVANSSGFHRASRIASLDQSLTVIGLDMVKTLLISESVFQLFDNITPHHGDDLRGFWKHSLITAEIARLIAEKMGEVSIEEAYLAGLLHDVGRLALLAVAPREYAHSFLADDDENLCALELRTLQMTHAQVGASMIEHWKLDSFLADSVLYHHDPIARLKNVPRLVRVVSLAHRLVALDADLNAAAALCGISLEDVNAICTTAAERVVVAAEHLGIKLDGEPWKDAAKPASAPGAANNGLNAHMRNLVLAAELGRTWSNTEGSLPDAITRTALVLFDFKDAALFLTDASGKVLKGGAAGSARARLSEVSIPLDSDGSIVQSALQRRLATISPREQPVGIAEEQIARILEAECLVCLPLGNKDRCAGVLVGGAAPWQLSEFRKRESLLLAFGNNAAAALTANEKEARDASRELENLSEKFQQAAKRVAHEVNNPLSIIKNYLGVLNRKLARQEMVGSELNILNEEIDRVGQLVNQFAEIQPMDIAESAEIDTVIADVVRLFSATEFVPATVKILTQAQDEACEVDGDVGSIKQILINLIKNAVEAMPSGGTIEISNNGVIHRDGRTFVEIWVRDTGTGLPPAIRANLGSPVSSTKGGEHRGLGLNIVHSLVAQMQGLVHCRSGKSGTTFELLLPVARAGERAALHADRTAGTTA
ncbi:MAG: HDOD domain-containing protein [Burkholderiaceae bacterium]|nr:HDOD domain-containing protein [Burkholderiaceae bacterium]